MNALHASVLFASASMALALGCASDPSGAPEGVLPPGPAGTVPTPAAGDAGAPPTTHDAGAPKADAATPPKPPADRGFLDPNQPSHSVFSGVAWSVSNQMVVVASPPAGSVATVTTCMKTYGTSIVKYADLYRVSRASVVATAITESNCTNPAGSSDGLSSGPMQVTGGTCAGTVSGYTSAACLAKMHSSPDFSFMVGAKYMGSSYQVAQHDHDPPKIAAAYNAGSIRSSTANRWHMVVTGNHIERWVGAYNAYRAWEKLQETARIVDAVASTAPSTFFEGENVASETELPATAREGQVYFVGDWAGRDGEFRTFRGGAWLAE
jgi:hypothetical protein